MSLARVVELLPIVILIPLIIGAAFTIVKAVQEYIQQPEHSALSMAGIVTIVTILFLFLSVVVCGIIKCLGG